MDKELVYGDEEDLRKNRADAVVEAMRIVGLLRLRCLLGIPCSME